MNFILAILICSLLILLPYLTGRLITKKLSLLEEENNLLRTLLNIGIGMLVFLMIVTVSCTLTSSFNTGLIVSFGVMLVSTLLQLKDIKNFFINLKDTFVRQNSFSELIIGSIDNYLFTLILITNLIYGLTAFSTTKLERFNDAHPHTLYINYLLSDSFIKAKTHLGSDILGALISKFSHLHPEVSLDILTMLFLNLSLLLFYSLAKKFLSFNKINKYIVPFSAFLVWGPISNLFFSEQGEPVHTTLITKAIYLSQTKLINAASSSGLVLHWFFSPPTGFSVFFFLVVLYFLFNLFSQKTAIKSLIFAGTVLGAFVIVDFIKFMILVLGTIVFIFSILFSTLLEDNKSNTKFIIPKNLWIFFTTLTVITIISTGFLTNIESYIPLQELKGTPLIENKFGSFQSNTILLIIYTFGFYLAYKFGQSWTFFLVSFFIISLILPYLVPMQDASIGKITMTANLLGAFALPLTFDFLLKQFKVGKIKQIVFYCLIFIFLSTNTLMFWSFGDTTKPLFTFDGKYLKYTGLQQLPPLKLDGEFDFIRHINPVRSPQKTIIAEPEYAESFSSLTGLRSISQTQNPLEQRALCSLSNKLLAQFDTGWLYVTPKFFKFFLLPEARKKLLRSYLKNKIGLSLSNKREDTLELRELFKINEVRARHGVPLQKKSYYINQIALCPYFGIYNAMSNNFDGDNFSDIAFFNPAKGLWHIIYGKDLKEKTIDLTKSLVLSVSNPDLLIPIPSDYDGDSKTDIALFNLRDSSWSVLKSSDSQVDSTRNWGSKLGEIPLPFDIDGDSKTDLSCYNSSDSFCHNLLTTNGQYYPVYLGCSPLDTLVYSDVDGDKKGDFIVYRGTTSTCNVYLSTLAYDRNRSVQIQIGDKLSRIVPGDYDGDGKSDLATWSPKTGKWEIVFAKDFLQPNKIIEKKTFYLGKKGDIPMPGDYDGDGKIDIAVLHTHKYELEIVFTNGAKKIINLSKYKNLIPASFIGV